MLVLLDKLIMKCPICNVDIPEERIELGFETCIKHSTAKPMVGFMVFNHKTAPEIAIVNSSNKEGLRQAVRAFKRER
jgi:hypothetical protein